MFEQDEDIDFNFWPAFADTLLAVVFVIVIALGVVALILGRTVNLEEVEHAQERFLSEISDHARLTIRDTPTGSQLLCREDDCLIESNTALHLQLITFSDRLLFQPDRYELLPGGEDLLQVVGQAIAQSNRICEIQIQGHTDNLPTHTYSAGNMELGARRGISVFTFLRDDVGLDPEQRRISVTTYGEYRPVSHGDTPEDRSRNRRVELRLQYSTHAADVGDVSDTC